MFPSPATAGQGAAPGWMNSAWRLGQTVLHQAVLSGLTFGLRQPIADAVSHVWCSWAPGDPDQNRAYGDMLGNVAGALWVGVVHPRVDRSLRKWENALDVHERVPHPDDQAAYTNRHNAVFVLVPVAANLLLDCDQLASDSKSRAGHAAASVALSVVGSAISGGLCSLGVAYMVWLSPVRMRQHRVDPTRPDTREATIRGCSAMLLGTASALFEGAIATARLTGPARYYALEAAAPLLRQLCWVGGRRGLNALLPATPAAVKAGAAGASTALSARQASAVPWAAASTSAWSAATVQQFASAAQPATLWRAPPGAPRKNPQGHPSMARHSPSISAVKDRDFENAPHSLASTDGVSTSVSPSTSRASASSRSPVATGTHPGGSPSRGSPSVNHGGGAFSSLDDANVTIRPVNPWHQPGAPRELSLERDLPSVFYGRAAATSPSLSGRSAAHEDFATPDKAHDAEAVEIRSSLRRRKPASADAAGVMTPMPALLALRPLTLVTPASAPALVTTSSRSGLAALDTPLPALVFDSPQAPGRGPTGDDDVPATPPLTTEV